LWAAHREEIEAEAERAGVAAPWIRGRLIFCDMAEGRR